MCLFEMMVWPPVHQLRPETKAEASKPPINNGHSYALVHSHELCRDIRIRMLKRENETAMRRVRTPATRAAYAGYSVLLCNSNENAEQERSQLTTLFSRRVDGILLACSSGSTAHHASVYRRCPFVFIDATVCADNVEAARVATEHLINLGHHHIALLAGDLHLSSHADRLQGFSLAMQRANLPIRDEYLCSGGTRIEDGQRAVLELMALKQPPTAIIASNTKLLLGLQAAGRAASPRLDRKNKGP